MQPPQVQSVEQIISDLNPAYQGQIDVINQRRAAIPGQYDAQRQALDAQKVQGFNDINNQATGRGLSFSGIPADEQANYLSTKYLPGMQQLATQQNQDTMSLDEAMAKIDSDRRLNALSTQQNQQKSLQDYLTQQQQLQWEQQKFAADQALQRAQLAQQLQIANADRAASQASQPTAPTAAQSLAAWAQAAGGDYRKNFSFENNILGTLKANYGLSNAEAYQLRKSVLGY